MACSLLLSEVGNEPGKGKDLEAALDRVSWGLLQGHVAFEHGELDDAIRMFSGADASFAESRLGQLKQQRAALPHHIPIQELPQKDRSTRLRKERKHLSDTIKMISYRAETSMVSVVVLGMSHPGALAEPYVNVSAHTAPAMEPRRTPICHAFRHSECLTSLADVRAYYALC